MHNAQPNPKMHHTVSRKSMPQDIATESQRLDTYVSHDQNPLFALRKKEGEREGRAHSNLQAREVLHGTEVCADSCNYTKMAARSLDLHKKKKQYELSGANRNTRVTSSLLSNPTLTSNPPIFQPTIDRLLNRKSLSFHPHNIHTLPKSNALLQNHTTRPPRAHGSTRIRIDRNQPTMSNKTQIGSQTTKETYNNKTNTLGQSPERIKNRRRSPGDR